MNIYLIMQNEEDYRQIISVPISAHPTREAAEAEAARLDLDAAWASNQPDYDGGGLITHHVYEIPFMSTPLDIAPPALPDPPAAIYLPLSLDEFIALVRAGKVHTETPDGGTAMVFADFEECDRTLLSWDYHLDITVTTGEWVHAYAEVCVGTQVLRHGDQVIVGSETFTITREP